MSIYQVITASFLAQATTAIFLFVFCLDFSEEIAERFRMSVEILSGWTSNQRTSVIALAAGSMGGGDESKISGGFIRGIEAGNIAEGGENSLRDGEVDAGES